jgi:hypothetical protein
MHLLLIAVVTLITISVGETHGQVLESVLVGAKLPTALYLSTAVYDGNDSVYIFGGYDGSGTKADILRYSLPLDKVEKVSSLGIPTLGGLALPANDGVSIYYFGGSSNPTHVHKFNTATNETVRLRTDLPVPVYISGGVSSNGSSIFLFSGHFRTTQEFNQTSETSQIRGDLPFQSGNNTSTTVRFTTAIQQKGVEDGVWLFAGNDPKPTNPVLLFSPTNNTVDIPSGNSNSLPRLYEIPVSVTDGRHGYLIGGIGKLPESDGSLHPTNGIIR